jgi:20S proteasome subunit alpha 1
MSRETSYDRYISIFSPEGRLYQLEYANKAVDAPGLTTVGVRGRDSVCLVTQRKVPDKLIDPASMSRVFNITDTVGCVMTGHFADGRSLVAQARQEASNFEYNNGFAIPPAFLANRMADLNQVSTQHAGRRTMGADMILCGIDEEAGPQLYRVDSGGSFLGYKATAAGAKHQEAESILEKKVDDSLSLAATVQLAIMTLQTTVGADFKPEDIEVAIVQGKDKFRLLKDSEVEEHLTAIAERD